MSYSKKNYLALPRISSQMGDHSEQSSLAKLSKELSSYSKFQQKQRENKSVKMPKKTQDVQATNNLSMPNSFINEYRDELKKIKKVVQAKKIKQAFQIEDKLNRIQRLTAKQMSQSVETPRSLNYINLAPPPQIQQPIYSIYQPPPPPPPPFPYGYNPYLYPPNPYQSYHDSQQSYQRSRDRIRRRDRMRTENGYERERNYDQYDDDGYEQPRYQKLKQTNTRIIKRNNRSNNFFSKKNAKKLIKRLKIFVWAIYFTYLLPRYSQKIMKVRSQMFKKFEKKKFNTEMTMMQKYLVKKCKPFFMYIANQKYTQFIIEQGQTKRMEEQKAIAIKKLINMIIQGLLQFRVDDLNEPATRPAELMHMFCKHGAFPFNIYYTEEQLDLVTISEKNKYIRMDKNLQKSQLINLICNKILLYNTILQPSKVDGQVFSAKNQIINKNFYFIGSIWYQICLQIQDQYLSQVPPSFELANWRKLKEKLNIRAAKSLSANGKEHEDQEIISGMLGKKKIQELFGSNFWRKQKNSLKIAIEHLHSIIVEFHKEIKAKIKF